MCHPCDGTTNFEIENGLKTLTHSGSGATASIATPLGAGGAMGCWLLLLLMLLLAAAAAYAAGALSARVPFGGCESVRASEGACVSVRESA